MQSDSRGFHKLRSDFITQAIRSGKAERRVKEHSDHESWETFNQYVEEAGTFQNNPSKALASKGLAFASEAIPMSQTRLYFHSLCRLNRREETFMPVTGCCSSKFQMDWDYPVGVWPRALSRGFSLFVVMGMSVARSL
jgi:hypothetical protein